MSHSPYRELKKHGTPQVGKLTTLDRRMDEAPGHLVDRTDRDDAVSVLSSALLFIWDCRVLRADGGPVFHCSHDEWNAVFVPAGQSTDEVVRVLQELRLRK